MLTLLPSRSSKVYICFFHHLGGLSDRAGEKPDVYSRMGVRSSRLGEGIENGSRLFLDELPLRHVGRQDIVHSL